ncbi:MAG: hypothetical protein U0457_02975 [Candidatus Sericytochromatia bacterium]
MDPVSNLPPVGLPPLGTPTTGTTTPTTGLPTGGTTTTPTTGTTTVPNTGLPPIGTPPGGTGLPPTPPTPPGGLGTADNFTQISTYVGSGLGGAIGTMKSMGNLTLIGQGIKGTEITNAEGDVTKMGGSISDKVKGSVAGVKELGGSAVTGAKYGAILGGGISLISNAYNVLTGKTSTPEAAGKLAADTLTATASGAGGAVLGGVAALTLSSFGVGGLGVMIPSVGLGLVGAVGVTYLAQSTGLYDKIKSSVQKIFGQ